MLYGIFLNLYVVFNVFLFFSGKKNELSYFIPLFMILFLKKCYIVNWNCNLGCNHRKKLLKNRQSLGPSIVIEEMPIGSQESLSDYENYQKIESRNTNSYEDEIGQVSSKKMEIIERKIKNFRNEFEKPKTNLTKFIFKKLGTFPSYENVGRNSNIFFY